MARQDRPFGDDMREFAVSFFGYWYWWITLCLASGGTAIYQQGGRVLIPNWVLWLIPSLGVVIAAFLAWRKEKGFRLKAIEDGNARVATIEATITSLKEQITQLQSKLDQRENLRKMVAELSGQWANGKELLKKLPPFSTEEGFQEKSKQWHTDVSDIFVRENDEANWHYFLEETKHRPKNAYLWRDIQYRVLNLRDIID